MQSTSGSDTTYGQCRWCLATGNHKDVTKEYCWNSIREVYIDLFEMCFNINLRTRSKVNPLVCDMCIQRLREANNFRMMVLSAETQLQEILKLHGSDLDEDNLSLEFKKEVLQLKIENDDSSDEYNGDQYLNDNIEDLNVYTLPHNLLRDEERLLTRFSPGSVKPLPKRGTLHLSCPGYVKYLDQLSGKLIHPKTIQKSTTTHRSRVYITEKLALVHNISTLLKNSNIVPFKTRTRNGFPCFYCPVTFADFASLREHSDQKHVTVNPERILKLQPVDVLVVNADITDLKCRLCAGNMNDLTELRTHLSKEHDLNFYKGFNDRVVPFRAPAKGCLHKCQCCGSGYETLITLERHMNNHFRNFICDQCGSGFITKYRLKAHLSAVHLDNELNCISCKKVFKSQQKYKNHIDEVHRKVKRNRCTKCSERFADYFTKHKHMAEVHGEIPLVYKCTICESKFSRRYTLSLHIKRTHLKDKSIQCEHCPYQCLTRKELSNHMIKHNGERVFECAVCKKAYARKKTLTEHMKIHNNDRRFICPVCGQAFVQNCTLKGHMKKHYGNMPG